MPTVVAFLSPRPSCPGASRTPHLAEVSGAEQGGSMRAVPLGAGVSDLLTKVGLREGR